MSKVDTQEIQGANKQTCIYTSFICQFMLTYMFYSILKIIFIAEESAIHN